MNDHEKSRFLRQAPVTATPSRTSVRPLWRNLLWTLALCLVGAALILSLNHAPLANAMPLSDPTPTTSPTVNARFNGTDCNLVDAITAANTGSPAGRCAAGNAGADTIELLSNVFLTAVNNGNNGLPVITSAITIEGRGYIIARDTDAPFFRILTVETNGDLTLNATTITGGDIYASQAFAGGIYNNFGKVRLNNSIVNNNTAGFGGGIYNNCGTLTLSNSTVSGNNAIVAGGIYNNCGTLTLSNSTVSGNIASVVGSIGSIAGGIYNNSGTLSLSNSTVSGNRADRYGGIFNYNLGTVILERNLIAGNQSSYPGAEIYNLATIVSSNDNLFGHSGESNSEAFYQFTPSSSDITATSDGTRRTALSSILETTLATNGGRIFTHALVIDSPAVDAVPSGPATDQRGVERPQGAAYDIGAFELEPLPLPTTMPLPATSTNTPTPVPPTSTSTPAPTNTPTPAPPTSTPTPAPRWTRTPRPASYSAVANNDQAMTNEVTPFGSGELTTVADEEQAAQAKTLFLPLVMQ